MLCMYVQSLHHHAWQLELETTNNIHTQPRVSVLQFATFQIWHGWFCGYEGDEVNVKEIRVGRLGGLNLHSSWAIVQASD